jgi:hypothetical protein
VTVCVSHPIDQRGDRQKTPTRKIGSELQSDVRTADPVGDKWYVADLMRNPDRSAG